MLFIFMAKMAVNSWRKAENRCVAVTYSPYIDWKSPRDKDIEAAFATELHSENVDGSLRKHSVRTEDSAAK